MRFVVQTQMLSSTATSYHKRRNFSKPHITHRITYLEKMISRWQWKLSSCSVLAFRSVGLSSKFNQNKVQFEPSVLHFRIKLIHLPAMHYLQYPQERRSMFLNFLKLKQESIYSWDRWILNKWYSNLIRPVSVRHIDSQASIQFECETILTYIL